MSRFPDETERARAMLLERLALLWGGTDHAPLAQRRVLRFVGACLGLEAEACDPAWWTIEQCRAAWRVTAGLEYAEARAWCTTGRGPPERAALAYPEGASA